MYEESLALAQEVGDVTLRTHALHGLGNAAYYQGAYQQAAARQEESLKCARELGDRQAMATALDSLGLVARAQGACARALADHLEGLALFRDLGNPLGMAACLEGVAGVACAQAAWGRAARLYAATACVRAAQQVAVPTVDQQRYNTDVAAIRTALGPVAFAAAWTEGGARTLDDTIAEAVSPVR